MHNDAKVFNIDLHHDIDKMSMKIKEIYDIAVQKGMEVDVRGKDKLEELLEKEKEKYKELEGKDKEVFDKQRLENPFHDSRLLHGDPETEVDKVMAGINIDTGEVVLADRLNEKGEDIDLIIGNHHRGLGLATLHEVMDLQVDMLNEWGVPINVAEGLMKERIQEVERKVRGANHNQSLDAAKLLDFPMMCMHTPADNLVENYLSSEIEERELETVGDVLEFLNEVPEFHEARKHNDGPTILLGSEDNRAGKVVVEMTGGTEGNKKSYEKMAEAGVGTVIGMHLSEDHRKTAKKNHINYIIAGHMASDSIGMNLFLDELEKNGVEIVPTSGFIRHSRN